MLTVSCVLRAGGGYGVENVERLGRQVAANLAQAHRFVCLSGADVPGKRIALAHDWPGWWAKIELFRPGLFNGRVLYLDLDVAVVGALDEIAEFPAPFAAIADYERPGLNSSVMVWDAGAADHIYSDFAPEIMARLAAGGDQAWISECLPNAARFPPEWCPSWKHDVRRRNVLRPDAKLVVYHGRPKPWDLPPDHLDIRRMVIA